MDLTSESPERERLVYYDVVYKEESKGHKYDTPVIHLFCRNSDGDRRHVEVEGFRPAFYISYDTFVEHYTDLLNDRRVLAVETDLSGRSRDERDRWTQHIFDRANDERTESDGVWGGSTIARWLTEEHTSLVSDTETFRELGTATTEPEQLVKVFTKVPSGVGGGRAQKGLRHSIESNWDAKTWEADIPFERRFLISAGVYRGFSVPNQFDRDGRLRVRYENWAGASESAGLVQEIEPCDVPEFSEEAVRRFDAIGTAGTEVRPRMLTVDIEVATHGGGVPDPVRARNEITAITAHDSYQDSYDGWFLRPDSWSDGLDEESFEDEIVEELGFEGDVSLWTDETAMLEDFNEWVTDRQFDVITGWNSDTFDYPYLIQRSYEINSWRVKDWDSLANPGVWRPNNPNSDDDVTFKVDGMVAWDMLDAYKKTLFRDISSYRLDSVAELELDYGKAPIEDIDEAWKHDPIDFVVYNTRDVEAVVEIERETELLDLYEHMRGVTGATLTDCHTNGPMIDTLFLRHAYNNGLALPSNVEPEVGDFHGAHVFDPVPGLHKNVIYPDLSSLYPYLIWTLNVSPETFIHDEEELAQSEYTEEDVFEVYIDKRGFVTIPKGQDASVDAVDTDSYKGILDESGSLRSPPGMFEPRYDTAYMVKPDVQEGFIRETVDELVDMKYEYKGEGVIYDAVKRVTNSVWGVLGDSASMGNGFRLFDWRLGEVITLGGRKVIQYTADEYVRLVNEFAVEDGYPSDSYLVGGDTDSCQSSIPMAPDYQTALEWAQMASEEFLGTPDDPGLYDTFMEEEFDVVIGEDEHRMEVEIESLASGIFFKRDFDRDEEVGVKKRYTEHELWGDSHGWIDTPDADEYENAPEDPEDRSELKYLGDVGFDTYENGVLADQDPEDNISITGFEYVRSDIAPITADAQMNTFVNLLLADDYEDAIYTYLEGLVDDVQSHEVPLDYIGRTKGVSKALDEYGWKTYEQLSADDNYTVTETDEANGGRYVSTPGPTYRGLKYAIDHFEWQEPTTKPVRLYLEDVRPGEYPEVYQYTSFPQDDRPDPPEVNREVDAIAVDEPDRLPEEFIPDFEKMLDKELKAPLEDILRTIGMDWSSVVGEGRQSGLDQFM